MFQLTKGTDTYDFDIAGDVQQNGAAAGKWSTNQTNQIVLTKPDTTTTVLDVDWSFNENNQLELAAGGAPLINFNKGTVLPLYSNQKDVLIVQPDDQNPFTFPLRGAWDLDKQHNLTLQIGAKNSTLDGFLQDPSGQFTYHFFDLENPAGGNENVLTFAGKWRDAVENGAPMLDFDYEKEDGTTGTFDLPANVKLDPNINEFVYDYDKNDQSFRIQFVGTLHITSDFRISYKLDRQTSSATGTMTTFSMDAVYHNDKVEGELKLALKKADGTPGLDITVGGTFTAQLGTSTLSVGFSFTQPASGNSQTIGFNGKFATANGSDITWNFASNSTTMSVSLAGHIVIGAVQGEGRLNITAQNGKVVGIHAMFGIKF